MAERHSEEIVRKRLYHRFCIRIQNNGLSSVLTYENGRLQLGATVEMAKSAKITQNIMVIRSIPHNIPFKGRLVVSSEVFMSKKYLTILRQKKEWISQST